jgi:hypothetical protein
VLGLLKSKLFVARVDYGSEAITQAGSDSISMRAKSKPRTTYVSVPAWGYLPDLIAWLNAANGSDSFDRLMRIREKLLQIQNYAERSNATEYGIVELEGDLHLLLCVYRFTLGITYDRRGPWSPRTHRECSQPFTSSGRGGQVEAARLCEECKENWLIGIREMDRFCKPACRVQHRLGSEEYKLKQRQKTRTYRSKLKVKTDLEDKALRPQQTTEAKRSKERMPPRSGGNSGGNSGMRPRKVRRNSIA